jgi:hypothetical protein
MGKIPMLMSTGRTSRIGQVRVAAPATMDVIDKIAGTYALRTWSVIWTELWS